VLTLVIGDKYLSSWSLRPWILLRHLGLPFGEVCLPLDTAAFHAEIGRHSPSRRVPVLRDDGLTIWDSMAICEYVSELAGGRGWPDDRAARARARSVCAEMHSGFAALRDAWSLRAGERGLSVPLDAAARADLARIDAIWCECRERSAGLGPWLFGAQYGIADAMYAPMVLRFESYGAALSPVARGYFGQALADPHLLAWVQGARDELSSRATPPDTPSPPA